MTKKSKKVKMPPPPFKQFFFEPPPPSYELPPPPHVIQKFPTPLQIFFSTFKVPLKSHTLGGGGGGHHDDELIHPKGLYQNCTRQFKRYQKSLVQLKVESNIKVFMYHTRKKTVQCVTSSMRKIVFH